MDDLDDLRYRLRAVLYCDTEPDDTTLVEMVRNIRDKRQEAVARISQLERLLRLEYHKQAKMRQAIVVLLDEEVDSGSDIDYHFEQNGYTQMLRDALAFNGIEDEEGPPKP